MESYDDRDKNEFRFFSSSDFMFFSRKKPDLVFVEFVKAKLKAYLLLFKAVFVKSRQQLVTRTRIS